MSWHGPFANLLRRLVPRAAVRGRVDGLEGLVLRGWGAGWGDRRVAVSLAWGGRPLPVELERESRPDVVQALRVKVPRRYGFRLVFGPAYWRAFAAPDAMPPGAQMALRLDGRVFARLPAPRRADLDAWFDAFARDAAAGAVDEDRTLLALAIAAAMGGAPAVPPPVRDALLQAARHRGLADAVASGDAEGAIARARATRTWLDASPPFAWQGWACAGADAVESFVVAAGEARWPVSPRRVPRADVAERLGVARVSLGFSCDVPAAVWRAVDADGACEVSLQVGGRRVDGSARRIDAAGLAQAIDEAMPAADDPPVSQWPATRLARAAAALDRLAAHAREAARAGWLPEDRARAVEAAQRDVGAIVRARGLRVSEPGSLRFTLEQAGELTFSGWACDVVANDEVFELACDGRPVPVAVQRVSRGDVQEVLQSPRTDLGFVVPIPVAVWESPPGVVEGAPATRARRLSLSINGTPVREDVVLDARVVADELVAASRALGSGAQVDAAARFNRSRWLHLLAHADALGGVASLGPVARDAVDRARARLRLSDRLDLAPAAPAHGEPPDASDTPEARLAADVARWQKRLNDDLARHAPAAALERLLDNPAIDPRTRDHLLLHLTPWACAEGVFDRVGAALGVDAARHFAEGGNAWHRTLLLPFLAEAGAFEEAAGTLADVASRPAEGWINTECVAHAVRRALAAPGEPTEGDGEAGRAALMRAFVSLVDALRPDPWSRLTDAHLVAAMAAAVRAPNLPGGAVTRAAVDGAARRALALQPDFWRALQGTPDAPVADGPLATARADAELAFEAVRALRAEDQGAAPDRGQALAAIAAARPALDRLRAAGCDEAAAWIRELALASTRLAPGDAATTAQAAAWLATLDAADPWRALSSPWATAAGEGPDGDAMRRAARAWPEDPLRALAGGVATGTADAGLASQRPPAPDEAAARWKAIKPALHARAGHVGVPAAVRLLDALGDESAPEAASLEALRLAILAALRPLAEEAAHRASAGLAPPAPLAALLAPDLPDTPAGPARESLRWQLRASLPPAIADRLGPGGPSAVTMSCVAARRAPGVLVAVDVGQADGLSRADGLAAQGFAVVALVARDQPDAGGPALRLVAPGDARRRLDALADWSLAESDAVMVVLVAADGVPAPESIEALVPPARHYVGWPAHRRARVAREGERLSGAATRVDVADRRSGFALSRWALAAWRAHPDASADARDTVPTAEARAFARLGADDQLAEVLARAGVALWPAPRFAAPAGDLDLATPKLWPTGGPARIEAPAGSNHLRLRSPRERVARLDDAPVIVVAVARNEREMLPHFLSHYRGLGVRGFVVVDNGSDDGGVELLLAQPDVVLYEADTQYRQSHYGVAWQLAVLAAHGQGRWALVADLDELLVVPAGAPPTLDHLVAALDAQGATAAEVRMVDMYPRGGLAAARLGDGDDPFAVAPCFDDPPLRRWRLGSGYHSSGATWLSGLRHRLIPDAPPNAFTSQKIALLRWAPWVRLSEGLHYASGLRPAATPLHFAHFKYHARFLEKVEDEIRRMQHYDDAAEYRQYLGMREAATQGFFAEGVSGTWSGPGSFAPRAEGEGPGEGRPA